MKFGKNLRPCVPNFSGPYREFILKHISQFYFLHVWFCSLLFCPLTLSHDCLRNKVHFFHWEIIWHGSGVNLVKREEARGSVFPNDNKIVAAFRGMHVSPAKHSYASVRGRQTDGRTDRQTDKVIPMCRYASQATQKYCTSILIFILGGKINPQMLFIVTFISWNRTSQINTRSVVMWSVSVSLSIANISFTMLHRIRTTDKCKYMYVFIKAKPLPINVHLPSTSYMLEQFTQDYVTIIHVNFESIF